ncbi:MAG: rhodanese-like domain-containing protein [Candidatus Bipolaricaulota bacterium]|nr:rhodanese-like domain-containing protein [Candidatus Bipolaricaulota bacterium]
MKSSVGVLIGLMVLGIVGLGAPRIVVTPETYDFGTVIDGYVVQFNLVIQNAGDAPLENLKVTPSCGCTTAPLPRNRLLPGESVAVAIRFDTTNYSRYSQPTGTSVTVESGDPQRPRITVWIRGTVRAIYPYEGTAKTLHDEFYVLVDLRPAAAYAQGHLLGALSIPFADLAARLGELPRDRVIYLYDETGIQAVQAAQLLQQQGFSLMRAFSGGLARWWQLYGDLFFEWAPGAPRTPPVGSPYYGTFATIDVTRVAQNFLYIVDIRSPEAYAQGRFPGAVNVRLATQEEIAAWAATLPRPISGTQLALWIVDEDGSRAPAIAQYLQGLGFPKARALLGGIAGWRASYGDTLLYPAR